MKVLKNICVGVFGAYVGLTTLFTLVHLGDITTRAMNEHGDGSSYEDACSRITGECWQNAMKCAFGYEVK
jgi:hypothetical protein